MQQTWVKWILFGLLAFLIASMFAPNGLLHQTGVKIGYSDFRSLVAKDQIAKVTLRGRQVAATLRKTQKVGPNDQITRYVETRVPAFGSDNFVSQLEKAGVSINVEETHEGAGSWLVYLLPWIVIIGFYVWFWRRMAGGGGAGPLGALTQTRAKELTAQTPTATFEDVAGQDSAKHEVSEIIEFMREPDRFLKLGAEVPHGILLAGPPGTGKTLTARAVAGEAGVPFFHMSGSEFIEMVVGVGAARVRKTFEAARKRQPSILFIDEIDAIGRVRGAGLGGGHDEREQTLNQILDCMDGFGGKEAIIVLAATNRPDVLDPALLRPGRFDRRVTFELPGLAAREQILQVHTRNIPLDEDVDLYKIAMGTPGFSGADLRNVANEAAILAAGNASASVSARDFDEARDKVIMGTTRALSIGEEEHHRLAVHESGHTAVAHYLPNTDPLHKVTIIPRGQALGGTHQLPEEERYTLPEDYLRDRIAVMLAGRAAERVFLKTVSSGADDDIRQATRLARAMVTRWGMDETLGAIDLRAEEDNPFLGLEIAKRRTYSDTTAHEVDRAVRRLLAEAEDLAVEVIKKHWSAITKLISSLEENETLDRNQIEACLGQRTEEEADYAQIREGAQH